MRRLKRHRDYEIALEIRNENFIRPPRDHQRNWVVNRAMKEFADDLEALDTLTKTFIQGAQGNALAADRTQGALSDDDIMEDWQIPVMRSMAEIAAESGGDVLEVGFGRGLSSSFIQELGARSHTIVECNDSVVERYHEWSSRYPDSDIRLLHGRWQDVHDRFGQYDGIFFHTYPLNQDEYVESVINSATFAENFFGVAASHLRRGGAFTYLTNEYDSLSRAHQRLIFRHFSAFTLRLLSELDIPQDSRDALWGESIVIIRAVR